MINSSYSLQNDPHCATKRSLLLWQRLGLQDYIPIWNAMQNFTKDRTAITPNELWTLEHCPIYTLGQAGRSEHLLNPKTIPVIKTDRGGQVTYHGPGQIIAYVLYDLRRDGMGVKTLVHYLEQAVIELLATENIVAMRKPKMPGVYVGACKIASVGLRIKNGCSLHGISLNCSMDLTPFQNINPCGYPSLIMTQVVDLKATSVDCKRLEWQLAMQIATQMQANLVPVN